LVAPVIQQRRARQRAVAALDVIVAQPPVIHHDVVWSSRLQGKEGDALPLLELLAGIDITRLSDESAV